MKLFSQLFFAFSSVVGTVSVAAEPCAHGYGDYDMTACNECAESGNGQTGDSACCDAIYRHSLGRDDDNIFDDHKVSTHCNKLNAHCTLGAGECYPGLTCCWIFSTCVRVAPDACQFKEDAAAVSLVTSSSSTGTTTKDGPSFVLVVVGLLGAAMMAMKVVQRRHRGLYNEVDATATRINV